jgi:amphi-Trp domain-containing protein
MSTPELENEAQSPAAAAQPVDDEAAPPKRRMKGKIKFESVMQRSEAVAYFGALVDGLRHGQLQFRSGEENLALNPTEQVAVEVKASRKGDTERIAFELEWQRPEEQLEL